MKTLIALGLVFFLSIPAFGIDTPETKSPVDQVVTDYSVHNVGTSSPYQIHAALAKPVSKIDIFDSSGQTLQLIQRDSANVDTVIAVIYPGGNGQINVGISSGMKLLLKSLTSTADSGQSVINLFY